MMRDYLPLVDSFISSLRSAATCEELARLMEDAAREIGFRHWALIHHDDLRHAPEKRIDLKNYPGAVCHRLIDEGRYRRDPIIRACIFADSAFLWSELHHIIALDRKDRDSLAFGTTEGLNEGITVPCVLLGECMGSCTFAGLPRPEHARQYLGLIQMIGIFAFQAARRIMGGGARLAHHRISLHPRPRDCIVLAGRGYSNKQIARSLSLTPRTVDGYLTEARRLFGAHDRTELVVSAVLAGEIGLHELKPGQPG